MKANHARKLEGLDDFENVGDLKKKNIRKGKLYTLPRRNLEMTLPEVSKSLIDSCMTWILSSRRYISIVTFT